MINGIKKKLLNYAQDDHKKNICHDYPQCIFKFTTECFSVLDYACKAFILYYSGICVTKIMHVMFLRHFVPNISCLHNQFTMKTMDGLLELDLNTN